jgi:hypothetical protein
LTAVPVAVLVVGAAVVGAAVVGAAVVGAAVVGAAVVGAAVVGAAVVGAAVVGAAVVGAAVVGAAVVDGGPEPAEVVDLPRSDGPNEFGAATAWKASTPPRPAMALTTTIGARLIWFGSGGDVARCA